MNSQDMLIGLRRIMRAIDLRSKPGNKKCLSRQWNASPH